MKRFGFNHRCQLFHGVAFSESLALGVKAYYVNWQDICQSVRSLQLEQKFAEL